MYFINEKDTKQKQKDCMDNLNQRLSKTLIVRII